MLKRVCLLRSQGNNVKGIAETVGVDRRTIHRWLKKGEKARIGKYAKFYNDWEEATEDYYELNPPKNNYNSNHARGNTRFHDVALNVTPVSVRVNGLEHAHLQQQGAQPMPQSCLYGVKENPELATDVDNGVVLCRFCHLKYHQIYSRYNINPQDFEEFMNRFQVTKEF